MTLREHLQAIYDAHGQLTPEIVVSEARRKDHPLHPYIFDRKTSEAAEAWYRYKAHELIQRVSVVYREATDEIPEGRVRAFHAVRTEAGYTYEPAEKVATDPFLRELLLRDMEREWRQLERRYGEFEEFVSLVRSSLEPKAA